MQTTTYKKRTIYRITPEKVSKIKELIQQGYSTRVAAAYAGVSSYTVWNVKHGNYDHPTRRLDHSFQDSLNSIRHF